MMPIDSHHSITQLLEVWLRPGGTQAYEVSRKLALHLLRAALVIDHHGNRSAEGDYPHELLIGQ